MRIRNLAEIGYVSTQEVVALVRELQSGYRPDIVIFYDGVNDTTSALLEGEAGLTTNEINRRREFNLLQSPSRLAGASSASSSRIPARIVSPRRSADGSARRDDRIGQSASDSDPRSARRRESSDVMKPTCSSSSDWAGSTRSTRYSTGSRSSSRRRSSPRSSARKPRDMPGPNRCSGTFCGEFASRRNWASDPSFHDLSGIFDDSESLVFIDYCHTTESANPRIAEAIADDVIAAASVLHDRDALEAGSDGWRPNGGSVN